MLASELSIQHWLGYETNYAACFIPTALAIASSFPQAVASLYSAAALVWPARCVRQHVTSALPLSEVRLWQAMYFGLATAPGWWLSSIFLMDRRLGNSRRRGAQAAALPFIHCSLQRIGCYASQWLSNQRRGIPVLRAVPIASAML